MSVVTKFEIHRLLFRWQVVQENSFPNGVAGVRVRPFRFAERRFWRFNSAVKYVHDRETGKLDVNVITGWSA